MKYLIYTFVIIVLLVEWLLVFGEGITAVACDPANKQCAHMLMWRAEQEKDAWKKAHWSPEFYKLNQYCNAYGCPQRKNSRKVP